MKLIFLRHGSTNLTQKKIICGSGIDEPLNEKGKQDAREVAQKLPLNEIKIIFSSHMKCASETAEIIRKHIPKIQIIYYKLIMEKISDRWKVKHGNEFLKC